VLGIDPGLSITGYACLELGAAGAVDVIEAGVLRLARSKPIPLRLAQLHEDLSGLLAELKPSCMVVEQLFVHYRHVRTSVQMGHARGVVLLAGQQHGVALDELAPAEVKKAVTGNGQATKRQVQQSIMVQCGLDEIPEPSDLADALAIALCAARRHASAGVPV
jgi:crossover junction endodeoxyribonuclease RuvC